MLAGPGALTWRRYFREVARVLDVPWQIATGGDLAFPGVRGRRTAKVRLVNAYLPRLHAAAATDPALAAAFVRVTGLLDRPEALLRPGRLLRVLRGRRRARPSTVDGDGAASPADASRVSRVSR
jgi:hypothetical protein